MALQNVVIIDTEKNEVSYVKRDVKLPPKPIPVKGIDPDKLKAVLLSKGVISDLSEVE